MRWLGIRKGAGVYSTPQAAAMLGIARRTVLKWCALLDVPKFGNAYLISEADLKRIRKRAQNKPGRPKGS